MYEDLIETNKLRQLTRPESGIQLVGLLILFLIVSDCNNEYVYHS
jgi:hypothetical protein